MLKPIPAQIMRTTVTVRACTGTDRYENQVYAEYIVKHVHLQPTSAVRKTTSNTDHTLRSILFVDKRHSTPDLDWEALFANAHANNGDVRVIVRGVEYTVESVDALRDDTDCFHHYEIGLV
jgi:hypothetical protein